MNSSSFNPPASDCDRYWDDADWLSPGYILEHWCRQDLRCRQAKQQALFSACERGEVQYQRSDGKTFDDPIHELAARHILLIGRVSFAAWATTLEGKSPLPEPTRAPLPAPAHPRPSWADPVSPTRAPIVTAPATVARALPVAPPSALADPTASIEVQVQQQLSARARNAATQKHAQDYAMKARSIELYQARKYPSVQAAAQIIAPQVHRTQRTVARWISEAKRKTPPAPEGTN